MRDFLAMQLVTGLTNCINASEGVAEAACGGVLHRTTFWLCLDKLP